MDALDVVRLMPSKSARTIVDGQVVDMFRFLSPDLQRLVREAYNEDQPRDENGHWTSSGGGGVGGGGAQKHILGVTPFQAAVHTPEGFYNSAEYTRFESELHDTAASEGVHIV